MNTPQIYTHHTHQYTPCSHKYIYHIQILTLHTNTHTHPTHKYTLHYTQDRSPHTHTLTFPGCTVPVRGHMVTGHCSGGQNSNILGPWGGPSPLMAALLSRLSLWLLRETLAMEVLYRVVAANSRQFSESSRAVMIPLPMQGSSKRL